MSRGSPTSPELAALQREARAIIRHWPANRDREAQFAAARELREVNRRMEGLREPGAQEAAGRVGARRRRT